MADIPWDELMDAAGDSDFAPIPQGDYDVKIIETEATKSSTDKPMWKITAEVRGRCRTRVASCGPSRR